MAASLSQFTHTIDDIYALPDGQRAELIDGQIHLMAPPNTIHQKISWKLHQTIGNYIDAAGGTCDIFAAPFAVFLNEDEYNYVEPDISVICDRNKINDKGCLGAPDWIIEIVSPSTQRIDYGVKLFKYQTAIKYIGRYLRRPVIATSRIDKYDGDFVTFHYNCYENDAYVEETLPVTEFIERLIRPSDCLPLICFPPLTGFPPAKYHTLNWAHCHFASKTIDKWLNTLTTFSAVLPQISSMYFISCRYSLSLIPS